MVMEQNEATLANNSLDDSTRKGNWIRVYSGGKYYPLDPRPEEIYIEDIAHSLSLLCRYNGHIDHFYSVAEHCILLSETVPSEYAFEALLHDASEAYMSDIPRPLKYADELEMFRHIEDLNTHTINEKFKVIVEGGEFTITSPLVKEYDARIVTDEKQQLFNTNSSEVWKEALEPLGVRIMGYSPEIVEAMYLKRFEELSKWK